LIDFDSIYRYHNSESSFSSEFGGFFDSWNSHWSLYLEAPTHTKEKKR
jgi:hypothetical protein